MEKLIAKRINKAIKEKVFPGCVVGIVRRSGERTVLPFGRFTYEPDAKPIKADTIYDVASITKSIPTSSLLLVLIDKKKISLEDELSGYIPEFGNFKNKKSVSVKHLLTYTLDLDVPSMASLKDKAPDEIMETIIRAPLKNAPGSKTIYANSTALLIGLLADRVSGKTLDAFAEEYFFGSLGMKRTTFHPERFSRQEIAPTEFDEWRGRLIHGETHDESTYALQQKYISGIAGLFSTASDLLNFLVMLLNGGEKDGRKYFSAEMISKMFVCRTEQNGAKWGLGWALNHPHYMGRLCGESTFGKTGFTGCMVMGDLEKEVGIVLLSNAIHPKRPKNFKKINEVRRDIANIVFGMV